MKWVCAGCLFTGAMIFLLVSCQQEAGSIPAVNENNITLRFKPMVNNQSVKTGVTYFNHFNESFQISQFKFYVSQVDLVNTESGERYAVDRDQYFLIDAADSTTWLLPIPAPSFRFNAISFTIGVDSIRNVSGAQTGALDPAKGMFWTWNSGYIMAKLEGTSSVSSLPNNKFEYHIGGFKGPENVLLRPLAVFPSGKFIQPAAGKKSTVTIGANASEWFYGQHDIRIASIPVCTTPGSLAKKIAENYQRMFTVLELTDN